MLDWVIPSPFPPAWNSWLHCLFWSIFFAVVAHLMLDCVCTGKALVGQ